MKDDLKEIVVAVIEHTSGWALVVMVAIIGVLFYLLYRRKADHEHKEAIFDKETVRCLVLARLDGIQGHLIDIIRLLKVQP